MDYPFTQGVVADALSREAVFGARYPQLLLRHGDRAMGFRDGEYRTSDPEEIAFLLGVVADESRANKGVWVKQLPAPLTETTTEDRAEDQSARPRSRTRARAVPVAASS